MTTILWGRTDHGQQIFLSSKRFLFLLHTQKLKSLNVNETTVPDEWNFCLRQIIGSLLKEFKLKS